MTLFTPPQITDPASWRDMRVGILGGSFNPPHEGHIHISDIGLKHLGLDCVWWLVTPQNPLKENKTGKDRMESFETRLQKCQSLTAHHPHIVVSDLEQSFGTTRTIETVTRLKAGFPETRFVFLAGTDILYEFDRWHRWHDLTASIAMAFIARPPVGDNLPWHLFDQNLFCLACPDAALEPGEIYRIMDVPLNTTSSTRIRNSL